MYVTVLKSPKILIPVSALVISSMQTEKFYSYCKNDIYKIGIIGN